MKLSDFRALSFDCYGTLIDWESGIIDGLDPLLQRTVIPLSRGEVLEAHAQAESFQQLTTPTKLYRDLLAIVYKRLAEQWGVSVLWDECVKYGLSVREWKAFPDSVEALTYLKKHFRLVILSNVDNETFSYSNKKLGVEFDAVFTAEDIGSYKPSDWNFEYMVSCLSTMGVDRSDILHTAESLFHDHSPANRHELKSCWIYRRHDEEGFGATMDPGEMPNFDFRFKSMAELAEARRAESES